MPDAEYPIQQLMLSSIVRRCAQESELFFQREANDPRFCFELLRRAILEHNQDAWEPVYSQYRPLVSGWIARHPGFQDAGEELDVFVNATFERFWSALTPEKFLLFPDLKALLRYLQMCVHSVLVDHARQRVQFALRIEAGGRCGRGCRRHARRICRCAESGRAARILALAADTSAR